jgi:hypothetical protein
LVHRPFRSAVFLVAGLAALAGDVPAGASESPPPETEVQALKRELATLRAETQERIAALEARLAALAPQPEAAASPTPAPEVPPAPETAQASPAPTPVPVPPGAAGAGGPTGALPVYGGATASSKIFNPDIAVIGNFLGAAGKNAVDLPPSLEMAESEASFQAVVDPYARADFFFAFGPEGVEVEEGFITFPTLPGGLLMKVGKLRGSFGKVNSMHAHAVPWVDRPLVTSNLVGGEEGVSDAGISLSRLFPNSFVFLEATGEVFRGENEVFQAPRRRDLTYVGRLRAYRDITESTNLDLGGSIAHGHHEDGASTRLVGVDATLRYRPLRRAIYRRLLARGELVWSRRKGGDALGEFGLAPDTAFGAYASLDYQFARRWFAGARYDYSERALEPDLADKGGSLLLTWWPSEFSQIRAQYRHTRYGEGPKANELLFQFLFSIGAHGAHTF